MSREERYRHQVVVQRFCDHLGDVLGDAQGELPPLRQAGAVYRADPLFEAVADLSDALCGHEVGLMGEDVARTEALRVCRLAVLLWLSVVGEGNEDGR